MVTSYYVLTRVQISRSFQASNTCAPYGWLDPGPQESLISSDRIIRKPISLRRRFSSSAGCNSTIRRTSAFCFTSLLQQKLLNCEPLYWTLGTRCDTRTNPKGPLTLSQRFQPHLTVCRTQRTNKSYIHIITRTPSGFIVQHFPLTTLLSSCAYDLWLLSKADFNQQSRSSGSSAANNPRSRNKKQTGISSDFFCFCFSLSRNSWSVRCIRNDFRKGVSSMNSFSKKKHYEKFFF